MTQRLTLHYLFDPLCGWCYGALPAIRALDRHPAIDLQPLATGLFAGAAARSMKSFAAQAWAFDQRIAALTGQPFSEAYRKDVLGAVDASLDSTVATLAVTAVTDAAPDRVIEALSVIQSARYLHGKDVTSAPVVSSLLADLGLADAADRIETPDAALLQMVDDRTARAHRTLSALNLNGVPALNADAGGDQRVLDTRILYAGPDAALTALGLAGCSDTEAGLS
ncbi:MAG: DsbA family protein [Alphaproteobacteria bacterium]|nr:DsbA family protein [Alphaproteobacteria bacterium]